MRVEKILMQTLASPKAIPQRGEIFTDIHCTVYLWSQPVRGCDVFS
jgi:hypothetical protein